MTPQSKEWYAYCFDSASESGRIKLQILFDQEKITAKSENKNFIIRYQDLEVIKGGNNQKLFFYQKNGDTAHQFFSEDKMLYKEILEAGGDALISIKKEIRQEVVKKRNKSVFLIGVFLLLLGGFGAAVSVGYPIAKTKAVALIPTEVDQKIGDVAMKAMVKESQLVSDATIVADVNSIFARLKPHLKDYPYEFKLSVLKEPSVNAFALPGGQIVVHTGLLLKAKSPEEVAGVLAHEVIHVTSRHGIERIVSSLGIIVIAEVFLGDISGLLELVVEAGEVLSMAQFSQTQETEADTKGFTLLKKAQISADGMIHFFETMHHEHKEMNEEIKEVMDFLSTHPSDEKRVANLKRLQKENPYEVIAIDLDWQAFQKRLNDYLYQKEALNGSRNSK